MRNELDLHFNAIDKIESAYNTDKLFNTIWYSIFKSISIPH